nr:hydroquinone glucosyltransferase-like [Tanacetum cinerariifolium]
MLRGNGIRCLLSQKQLNELAFGLEQSGQRFLLRVANGVPMIAWPLFAEQNMNAVFLTDGLGVACRVKADEDGVVGRNEIVKCVRSLINGEDGHNMRRKMSELKDLGTMAMSQDGSSTRSLVSVAQQWV